MLFSNSITRAFSDGSSIGRDLARDKVVGSGDFANESDSQSKELWNAETISYLEHIYSSMAVMKAIPTHEGYMQAFVRNVTV